MGKHHQRKGGFAIGAVIGAATGAVAGLLFAPKSGEETRADIKHKAQVVENEVKGKAAAAKHKAGTASHEAKQTGQRFSDKARGIVKAGKQALTAETELGSKTRQAEAKLRTQDLKRDVKRTVKKATKKS